MEIDTTHYTARIVIERVDHFKSSPKSYVQGDVSKPAGRKVTELASLTLKGNELPALVGKVSSHLDLVEDIEAVDERVEKNYRR